MSLYLTLAKDFEDDINRKSKLRFRSKRLDALVLAIDQFIKRHDRETLQAVEQKLDIWKREDPKEFADRGRVIETDLRNEIAAAFTRMGGRRIPVIDPAAHPCYEPGKWNDGSVIQYSTNCYAYACNDPYGHQALNKPQPGQFGGVQLSQAKDSAVRLAVLCDDQHRDARRLSHLIPLIRLRADPVPEHVVNAPGYYLIALVTAPRVDYHWVRQDRDGMWSHKPGWDKATNLDSNGKVIYDPRVASFRVATRDRAGKTVLVNYEFTTYYYAPKGGVRTGDLGQLPARRNSI